ncbi:hypothetical protein [Paenibacillus sp. L3-i20]|uniref:hypothetical protein n=1 Tax=Paenibacillus sp. L3-i20 TaxID=2905833 RepID=UPI001EDFBF4D|nr:hypothetical protein [Paenibacillus sp. L3-i20]GKU76649.1 hypothetical protein L3i20_v210460 [Paenibacillus sp. L3-i20]
MKVLKAIGWIFVPYIMIFVSWKNLKKPGKALGTTWVVILLIAFIGSRVETDTNLQTTSPGTAQTVKTSEPDKSKKVDDSEAKKKADEQEKAKAEKERIKKNQSDVLAFEKTISTLEESLEPTLDNYYTALNGLADGSVDIFTAYEATEKARDASNTMRLKISNVDVPDTLPKKAKKALESGRSEISTAFYSKKKAFEAVLEYLDDQKPSHMSTFKDEIEMSDNFILRGTAYIIEAKQEVGIDITAK